MKKPVPSKVPAAVERLKQANQSKLSKLWGRLRPRKESAPKHIAFGQDVRKQRSRQQQQERLHSVTGPIWSRVKIGVRFTTLLIVIVVVGLIGGAVYLQQHQVYIVKDITVTGNRQISQDDILHELDNLRGKSMFSFSESGVEADLEQKFPYIKVAQVRKQLPGKITVEIEERYPTLAYINLTGVFLVDDEKVVVSQLGLKTPTPLTADELVVISGFGDPNANYVHEHYLSTIQDEEQRKAVKWDEVPLDDKKQSLQEYRDSLLSRVESSLNNNVTALLGTEFTQLPQIMGYDSTVYAVGSDFPSTTFDDARQVQAYMQKDSLVFVKMTWESEFTLTVDLASGIKLMFTNTRPIQDQLSALNTVRNQGDLSGATVIDLRSEIVAVR